MMVSSRSWTSKNETAKPMNHHRGVFRFKTSELILSVTDEKVRPGPTTGAVVSIGPSVYGSFAIETVQSSTFRLSVSIQTS